MDALTDRRHDDVSRGWWLYLIVGVLWIVFAWIVLSFEIETVWAVAVFFGVGFIVGGVAELMLAFATPGLKWLQTIFGVTAVVAGVVALAWPGQTFLALAAILGWYILFAGFVDIVIALATRQDNELWWLELIVGFVQVLIGFWAAGYIGRSMALLVVWVAAAALARGIGSLILGFGLHGMGKELRRRGGGFTARAGPAA